MTDDKRIKEAIDCASMRDPRGRKLRARRHLTPAEIKAIRRRVESGLAASTFAESVSPMSDTQLFRDMSPGELVARYISVSEAAGAKFGTAKRITEMTSNEFGDALIARSQARRATSPFFDAPDSGNEVAREAGAEIARLCAISSNSSRPAYERDAALRQAVDVFADTTRH